jgi:hypothetical protein
MLIIVGILLVCRPLKDADRLRNCSGAYADQPGAQAPTVPEAERPNEEAQKRAKAEAFRRLREGIESWVRLSPLPEVCRGSGT